MIVAAKRSPIGRQLGALSDLKPSSLMAQVLAATLASVKFPSKDLGEVVLGNVCSANLGQHPVKQAALEAKIPPAVPAMLVNRICGSGMISLIVGSLGIQAGYRNIVLCGGFESMSRIPHYAYIRKGVGYGNATLIDGLQQDGLTDAISGDFMGLCTDKLAKKLNITREDHDRAAIKSYTNAIKARDAKLLAKEICEIKTKKGIVKDDEELTKFEPEKMKKLKAAFIENGTITAANASKLSDGAQGVLIMSEDEVNKRGLTPRARIVAFAEASTVSVEFPIGAIEAAKKCLQVANMTVKDMDYVELNEAFATVPILGERMMGINPDIINVFGGAVALGHPLGMSGARIVGTLLNVLETKNAKRGLASICNGGGGGTAMIIERL